MQRHHFFIFCLVSALLLLAATATPSSHAIVDKDKLSPEEVLTKHLESIGSAEARASGHSRAVVGSAHATFAAKSYVDKIEGRIVLGSIEHKILYAMTFPAPNYPAEKFGFDGKKLTVGYLKPGVRSTLGSFILIHDPIFKEGLMGGTLSAAWPLLNLAERGAKLEYKGTTKIGDLSVHKLEYVPKKGTDLTITLFFDVKTFQHVRTQYDRIAGARLGTGGIDGQSGQRASRYRMVEDFSGYKQEGDLTLPHDYKLELSIETATGTSSYRWEVNFDQFIVNQPIADQDFNVEAN